MLEPHFRPFSRDVLEFDLGGSGAEVWFGIKGTPEEIGRIKKFLNDSLCYEIKRMNANLKPQDEVRKGGCGCKEGPLNPNDPIKEA